MEKSSVPGPVSDLTIAMIVKNEASNLAACLESCQAIADEIVIVDSGSEDDTIAIARRFPKVRLIEQLDWRGFGHQRQIAQEHVRSKWILWIDADERISPELATSISKAIASDQGNTVYALSRLSWVFGRYIRHSGWYPDLVVRLYPTALTRYTSDPVHEHVCIPAGIRTIRLEGDLLHYTYRDLQHYLVKSASYASLWARQRQQQGKRASISQGLLHAAGCFIKMYIVKAGFLDGHQGFLLAILSAHSTFAKYADLWIRQLPVTDPHNHQR